MSTETRANNTKGHSDILRHAEELFNQRPTWVTFFREVLGIEGLVRAEYTTPEELAAFEQTDEYRRIQGMLAKLRENDVDLPGGPREPTRVITVRLPKSLHESLRVEAHDRHTSINKLCIAKLVQKIDPSLVPPEADTNGEAAT